MVRDVNVPFSSARDQGETKGGVKELGCQPVGRSDDAVCRAYPPPIATERAPRRKAIHILTTIFLELDTTVSSFLPYFV